MSIHIEEEVSDLKRTVAELEQKLHASLAERDEALAQQTATADILRIINSSPGDLAPVFDAILEKAHNLCDAPCGSLQIYDGQQFHAVAVRGIAPALAAVLRKGYHPDANAQRRLMLATDRVIQIADLAEALMQAPDDSMLRAAVESVIFARCSLFR